MNLPQSTQDPSNLQVPPQELDLLDIGGMSRISASPGNLDFSSIPQIYGPGRVAADNEQFQMAQMDQQYIYSDNIHPYEASGQGMFGNNHLPGFWPDESRGN
jgi:hypothetical protein